MNEYPNVNIVFPDKYPDDFINDVNGWAFSKETIKKNMGKLLTLDIDYGVKCSLNCPHCFRRNNSVDHFYKSSIKFAQFQSIIKEAKTLGLKSVKYLGKGEPFEVPHIIEIIKFLNENKIIPLIFTKGHVIGDDNMVKIRFSKYGINNASELLSLLNDLNVSVLLGCNSFNQDIQNKMVGDGKVERRKMTYTDLRNRALELLVDAGFNKGNPTRLCLATNPVTNQNYNEIFDIYKWGRERNMYVVVTPTMISGRGKKQKYWKKITPSAEDLIDLYTKINIYNIEKNIQTLEQIEQEGISSYAGGHPCNQVSVGMYITLNGTVLRCPGDDETILGNVNEQSVKEIWENSENYGRFGQFNCGCPPKWGKSIPYNLFGRVLQNLREHFRSANGS